MIQWYTYPWNWYAKREAAIVRRLVAGRSRYWCLSRSWNNVQKAWLGFEPSRFRYSLSASIAAKYRSPSLSAVVVLSCCIPSSYLQCLLTFWATSEATLNPYPCIIWLLRLRFPVGMGGGPGIHGNGPTKKKFHAIPYNTPNNCKFLGCILVAKLG